MDPQHSGRIPGWWFTIAAKRRINNLCRPTIERSRLSLDTIAARKSWAPIRSSPVAETRRRRSLTRDPSMRSKKANKELKNTRTRSSSARNPEITLHAIVRQIHPVAAGMYNVATGGNFISEIFPENFRRVTLAYFSGNGGPASGIAALYRIWQIRRLATRTELIELTLREYVRSWGITFRYWQSRSISTTIFLRDTSICKIYMVLQWEMVILFPCKILFLKNKFAKYVIIKKYIITFDTSSNTFHGTKKKYLLRFLY